LFPHCQRCGLSTFSVLRSNGFLFHQLIGFIFLKSFAFTFLLFTQLLFALPVAIATLELSLMHRLRLGDALFSRLTLTFPSTLGK
jgi:hypothetical protein